MNRFPRPFKLGTTSFIYPGMIVPNVERLGRAFDEIELLVFESRPYKGISVLPSKEEVESLAELSRELDVTYNIHLPVDVDLVDPAQRELAVETLDRVVALMEPLNPSTHTLHLSMDRDLARRARDSHGTDPDSELASKLDRWHDNAMAGLQALAARIPDLKIFTVETLDYPPLLLAPILDAFPVQLCMDVGHHFKYDFDPTVSFERWGDRIPLVHLHGVAPRGDKIQDHIGLDRLNPEKFAGFIPLLASYGGRVSLEIFSLEHLNGSLGALASYFGGIPRPLDA